MLEGKSANRRQVPFRIRVRYVFDAALSKGIFGLSLVAVVGSALAVLLITLILWGISALDGDHLDAGGFFELFWSGFVGLFRAGDGKGPWVSQVTALAFAVLSIFFTGIVLGAVVTAMGDRFSKLREHGGTILATDHTVILGWSTLGPLILTELAIEAEATKRNRIAILADREKVELEYQLSDLPTLTTKILVRRGATTSLSNFERVRLADASRVIVLGDWGSPLHDIQVVGTLLALARFREAHPDFAGEIVTCVMDLEDRIPARVAAKYPITVFPVQRMLARLMMQVTRQPGLFQVLSHLLNLSDDKFHMQHVPELAGVAFSDLTNHFPSSTPIGIFRDGAPHLLPAPDLVITAEDEVIFLLPERSSTALISDAVIEVDASVVVPPSPPTTTYDCEDWLFIGWSPSIGFALVELDSNLSGARNTVTVVVKEEDEGAANILFKLGLENLDIDIRLWRHTDSIRNMLEEQNIETRTYVVIPCRNESAQSVDAETLFILLQARDVIAKAKVGDHEPVVVSELLEAKYRKIADVNDARDIVVSSEIVSLVLAQMAINPRHFAIFANLLVAIGPGIYLRPAARYVLTNRSVNFQTINAAALANGEIAIGYVVAAERMNSRRGFGVHLNPDKGPKVTLTEADQIVVIAAAHRLGPDLDLNAA